MPEIKVLPEEVISKIAAGEVIERPASVLKELLENSIDAGASHIDIEIEKAGRKLMRVRDDGKGMGQEDMKTALLRHSTSKLHNFDDLYSLATYGFRGEALYSISAVSRLKMTSCTEGADSGFTLECEGGSIKSMQPAPPVKGTVIEAADLFFNIPARAKFLKSDSSERAHLIRTAEEAVLANCGAAFRIRIDGTEILNVPLMPGGENANLGRRAEAVLGKKTFSGMKEISFSEAGISVHGFVSAMGNFGATRANQYYFVNHRPVSSQLLKQAFYKAYPSIPTGKHPACVLFVDLDPAEFDVNVHPQKKDVRFSYEGDIFKAMGDAVRQATANIAGMNSSEITAEGNKNAALNTDILQHSENAILPPGGIYGRGLPPSVKYRSNDVLPNTGNSNADYSNPAKADYGAAFASENGKLYGNNNENQENSFFSPESIPGVSRGIKAMPCTESGLKNHENANAQNVITQSFSDPSTAWKTAVLKYVGQLASSYLIFECERGMLVLDQHAAQERIFFERYLDELAQHKVDKQGLLVPLETELTRSQTENVMRWQEWLYGAGFEIDARGPDIVLMRAYPQIFDFTQKAFTEFVAYLADIMGSPAKVAEDVKRNVVATMACKKAIKARENINPEHAMQIMESLRLCRDGAHCPHGRPTMYYMTGLELARKFDRGIVL